MTDDMELKPCPFCGGGATLQSYIPLYDDAFVFCDRCEIEGPRFGDSNEKAIAAWNTRADLSQAAVEALEAKLAKAVDQLEAAAKYHEDERTWWDAERARNIRATLAELTGGKDE